MCVCVVSQVLCTCTVRQRMTARHAESGLRLKPEAVCSLPEVCGACSRGIEVACGVKGLQQLCQEGGPQRSARLNHLSVQSAKTGQHIL